CSVQRGSVLGRSVVTIRAQGHPPHAQGVYSRAARAPAAQGGGDEDTRVGAPLSRGGSGAALSSPLPPRRAARDLAEPALATCDAVRESGIVVDALGDAGLSTEAGLVDDDRFDALAGRINGRRETGRTAADDHQVILRSVGFECEPELARELIVRRFQEVAA